VRGVDIKRSVRQSERRRRVAAAAAALLTAVLVVANLCPFDWDPPRQVPNHVTRTDTGALHFTGPSQARTVGPAEWLDKAVADGHFEISLEFTPESSWQPGPARILAVSISVLAANVMVGQDGDDLVIRLRQPGRDGSGNPARVVPDVLADGRPTQVAVGVANRRLSVSVDGRVRLEEPLPPNALAGWKAYPLALGNEPRGSRPWQGIITRALVTTSGGTVDYLQPGALQIPDTYRYITHRPWEPLEIPTGRDAAGTAVHLLGFLLLGAAVAGALRRPRPVLVVVGLGVFSLALQIAKIGFADRHPSIVHILAEVLGAAVGVALVAVMRNRALGRCDLPMHEAAIKGGQ
jgi:VanZ family protein